MVFEAKSEPRRIPNPAEWKNDPGTVFFHENAMIPKEKAHTPTQKKTCFSRSRPLLAAFALSPPLVVAAKIEPALEKYALWPEKFPPGSWADP